MNGMPADVRQAAALTLAGLGSDAVAQAFWPQRPVRRTLGQRWRMAQALAWMRAAGRCLPELQPLWLRGAVSIGDRAARFRTDWRGIAVEALGAALGAAVAYVLWVAMMMWFNPQPGSNRYALAIASGLSAAGLGWVVGALTVIVARLLAPEPRAGEALRPAWQRVAGVTCGFVLGLAASLPAEFAYMSTIPVEARSLLGRYMLGGSIMGLGLALGLVIGGRRGFRAAIAGATCGTALAGLAIGALSLVRQDVGLPGFVPAGDDGSTLVQYALAGVLLGAGLAAGWLQGRRVWQHWQKQAAMPFG